MTHRELAELMATRLRGWKDDAHRRAYVEALVVALDDRRVNRCGCNDRPPANLIDGVAPECLYALAQYQISHQMPSVAAPAAAHGLRVEDVPRGMAGRLAALARSRSA